MSGKPTFFIGKLPQFSFFSHFPDISKDLCQNIMSLLLELSLPQKQSDWTMEQMLKHKSGIQVFIILPHQTSTKIAGQERYRAITSA